MGVSRDIIIEGNIVYENDKAGIILDYAESCVINNNNVNDNDIDMETDVDGAIADHGGIIITDGCKYNTISNNSVRNNILHGIYIADSTATDNTVSGTMCRDNGNIIDHGNCEEANIPHIRDDAALISACTFARDGGP